MYYYGARYYDPTLRRFITPDTIVQSPYDPQSLNRYAYCRNNPLKLVDPTGHEWGYAETGGEYDWFRTTDYFSSDLNNPFNLLANFSGFTGNLALNAFGSVGAGFEFAKQAVFGNSFAEALLGRYDSQAVDAYAFLYGGPLLQAMSSAVTYSKAALGAKLGKLATGKGYLANETGSLKLGSKMDTVIDAFKGEPQVIKLEKDMTVYRYWSGNSPETGSSFQQRNILRVEMLGDI